MRRARKTEKRRAEARRFFWWGKVDWNANEREFGKAESVKETQEGCPSRSITPRRARTPEKTTCRSTPLFLVGEGGFAFLRKSHAGCNVPPARCQEPAFESTFNKKSRMANAIQDFWWGKVDSNHRSRRQQIYSLPPLATREFPHIQMFSIFALAAQTNEAFVTRKGRRRERIWSFARQREAEWSELLLTLELVDGLEPPTC